MMLQKALRPLTPHASLCQAVGCTRGIPPGRLMCRRHWLMCPGPLKKDLLRTWRRGQGYAGSLSPEYLETRRAVIEAVAAFEAREGVQ